MIKPPDTKHPDRNPKVHSVSILSLKEKLIEISKRRGDSWADEVIHRLVGGNDLVDESAKYHSACYRDFTNPVSLHTTGRSPNDLRKFAVGWSLEKVNGSHCAPGIYIKSW